MYTLFNGIGLLLFLFSLVSWMVSSVLVKGLPYVKTTRSLIRLIKTLQFSLIVGTAVNAIWLLGIAIIGVTQDWLFIEGIVKVMVPVLLIGNLPIWFYTWPKLQQLNTEKLDQSVKISFLQPTLHIPLFAAQISSLMNLYLSQFGQPVLPTFFSVLYWPLILLLFLFVPSYFNIGKYQRAQAASQFPQLSGWQQIGRSLGVLSLMGIVLVGIIGMQTLIGFATKLPAAYSMMNHTNMDTGGQKTDTSHQHHQLAGTQQLDTKNKIDVKNLRGNISAPANRKFTIVAKQKKVTLQSGKQVNAWTYNGKLAPQLRVKEGDMVEVKLINQDIIKGVSIHWHGYNVPNAMDGVPGMTQDVVKPGGTFTYKFRAKQVGSYWFHSHQQASEQVAKGLFGSLIVEPKVEPYPYDHDVTAIHQRWTIAGSTQKVNAFGSNDLTQFKQVKPGQKVRIRVINATNLSREYVLSGARYQVTSIDGVPLKKPGLLNGTFLQLGAGGRYDVTFTMPTHPVRFTLKGSQNNDETSSHKTSPDLVFATKPNSIKPKQEKTPNKFDPTQYGEGIQHSLRTTTTFDREFNMIMGNQFGFYNGKFTFLYTLNGQVFPNTPTFMVKTGDKVKVKFVNRGLTEHPMHLHGHHMLVLTKNGQKVKTPWLTDTLNIQMGETYEVAFIADNPGMWMDHCHNLDHAAVGMTMHLMYENVYSKYEVGTKSGNLPD